MRRESKFLLHLGRLCPTLTAVSPHLGIRPNTGFRPHCISRAAAGAQLDRLMVNEGHSFFSKLFVSFKRRWAV